MALPGLAGSVLTLVLLWRQGSEYRRIARTPDRGREILLSTLSESELLRVSRRGAAMRAGGLLVFVILFAVGALLLVRELLGGL